MQVKVGLIGVFDMLKFKNLKKNRHAMIENAPSTPLPSTDRCNELAQRLHPRQQYLKIDKIIEESADSKSFILVADTERGTMDLAPFKAGNYINISTNLAGSVASRTYSISSSPAEALQGFYRITVKSQADGFMTNYLLREAQISDKFIATEPGGFLTHSGIRDCDQVIGLAGGTGVTPFVSMAKAIAEGSENFALTILYGARKIEDILFRKEFDAITAATDKVKVIYVLSDEQVEGYEHGFLSAELIKRYMGDTPCSIFVAGPAVMCDFLDQELPKLNLAKKYIRMERTGAADNAESMQEFALNVKYRDQEYQLKARSDETILTALERGGIAMDNKCRAGGCGFCRSRLIAGEYRATKYEKLRLADHEYHYFHPCCAYPLSDISMEIYSINKQ